MPQEPRVNLYLGHPLSKFNQISENIQAFTVNRAIPEDGVVLLLTFRPGHTTSKMITLTAQLGNINVDVTSQFDMSG